MTIVGGFDVHRQQITFDYVDNDGLVRWGQIRPGDGGKTLRAWPGASSALMAMASSRWRAALGWRYVNRRAGRRGRGGRILGDPAENRGVGGVRRSAPRPTRTDARLAAATLVWGRAGFPRKSWIPARRMCWRFATLGRLYCTLMDERARLASSACMPSCSIRAAHRFGALLSEAGRAALASVELSGGGAASTWIPRCGALMSSAPRSSRCETQLVSFARRQGRGVGALQRHYGHRRAVRGAIIWAEIR